MPRQALVSLALLAQLAALGACAEPGRVVMRQASKPAAEAVAAPGSVGIFSALPLAASPAQLPALRTVLARPGDSLWRLSRRWLGTGFRWREIAATNHLARPWIVRVGQSISIVLEPAKPAFRAPGAAPAGPGDEARRYGWKAVPNHAFTAGEKLTFAVQYGGMTAGYATLSIPAVINLQGRPVFHIVAEARSLPFFDAFFTVHDVLDSYSDVDYGFSWGYEKHLHEGRFKAGASYDYDQRRGLILEPAKGKQAPLPAASQDVLSCFYYFRTQPMAVGSVVSVPVTADDMKSYQLTVDVLRKERVSTLAGDFDCVVVQPHLAFKGVFRQRGEVTLWITDDRRRLPVLIRSKIVIGSININLQNAQWVQPMSGAPDERGEKKGL